nr:MAG TPA: hypothetical protein [Bacteriophage sp.]
MCYNLCLKPKLFTSKVLKIEYFSLKLKLRK